MRNLLLFVLPIVFLTNCTKFESKDAPKAKLTPVSPLGVQTEITQIGDFFNRTPLSSEVQKLYQASIFKLESDVSGKKGIAVYLGVFEDQHLFVTAKHVLDVAIDTCDFMVAVVSVDESDFFVCTGNAVSIDSMDITLFTAERLSGEDPLKPLKLSSKAPADMEDLVVRTIDRDLNFIVADYSDDCFVLDSSPQLIFDPDNGGVEFPPSWSVPIGCDAQPGDSGAPVMSNSGKLLGILWGGRAVKLFKSSSELKKEAQTKDPRVWKDYNFMVPAHIILSAIAKIVESEDSFMKLVLSDFLQGYSEDDSE